MGYCWCIQVHSRQCFFVTPQPLGTFLGTFLGVCLRCTNPVFFLYYIYANFVPVYGARSLARAPASLHLLPPPPPHLSGCSPRPRLGLRRLEGGGGSLGWPPPSSLIVVGLRVGVGFTPTPSSHPFSWPFCMFQGSGYPGAFALWVTQLRLATPVV